ncbi:energy transducer TonB [Shewanella maritima]|uniref:energy transducer TonB n=1 Tax=Shewanella maritima TaxID=2520507 RepID=UPI003735C5E7
MKIIMVLCLGLAMLSGCSSTPEQYLTEEPVIVDQINLSNYWVRKAEEFSFDTGALKPPKTSGIVKVKYLIDSNGEIFNPTVVESMPQGAWDKFALKALENIHYIPSESNASKTPVYVITEFSFGES